MMTPLWLVLFLLGLQLTAGVLVTARPELPSPVFCRLIAATIAVAMVNAGLLAARGTWLAAAEASVAITMAVIFWRSRRYRGRHSYAGRR